MTVASTIVQIDEVIKAWDDGSWDTLCREKMPASKFLTQTDHDIFDELIRESSLPCFTTDYFHVQPYPDRVSVPISDDEAHVSFYVLSR